MLNLALLTSICEAPGVSGFERRIRELVLREVRELADEVEVDNMGNVIAILRGKSSKRVMVAAHMDEIGFIVNHIDDKGFIRFLPLGGFDPKTLTAQRVIVHGREDVIGVLGCKPIHIMKPEERKQVVPLNEYFVDTGMTKEAVEKLISVGDPISRERALIEMGDCVTSKSLDNRVSVFILIETLRRLKGQELPHDLYATFTVQEEVGLRGAMGSVGHIDPDFGFGLDVTIAYDVPGSSPHEAVTSLGSGAAIKILDGSVISDYRMVNYLKEVARAADIKTQLELLPAGGTDTAAVQRYGNKGAIAGAISIPLRNMHQSTEMAHKEDILATIDLLAAGISQLGTYNWDFSADHGTADAHPDAIKPGSESDFSWM
ncbi:M42 family metallopeptidase [Neolewinella agarilytica]|uniref:Endoglucanase n=1 Tax=Neolewinella agarilytica TaxID=478744 RepID=A0A1H9LER3_9BACT|nr:M42 family metallopeptidase [Neolewinella agarilytica]SER09848.1 endoglucanase [Neolewinella agarilytica]